MTYDVEQKAQAIALVESGTTPAKAASLLGLGERSVQLWVKDFREISAKEGDLLTPQSVRLAQRAGDLIGVALDYMEEQGPEVAHKSLFVLNAIRGTAIDKVLASKRVDGGHDGTINIYFNTVPIPQRTEENDVIEGELVEPSEPVPASTD